MGNAKQLNLDRPQEQMKKWQNELGDVYMINLAGVKVVVVWYNSLNISKTNVKFTKKREDFYDVALSFLSSLC